MLGARPLRARMGRGGRRRGRLLAVACRVATRRGGLTRRGDAGCRTDAYREGERKGEGQAESGGAAAGWRMEMDPTVWKMRRWE